MHPIRIVRTTGFRLAALYAGVFGLSVAVLFAVVYWITGDALREQIVAAVNSEVAALTEGDPTPSQLVNAIDQRLSSSVRASHYYYLLLDPSGAKLAGNLPLVSARAGWQELPLPVERGGEDEGDHRLLAEGAALSRGGLLLVGDDLHRTIELKEAIVQAFGWALGVTIMLGALGGGLLSLGFLRRIDAMNRTTRAIIEGNLADRVPTRGTGDELDRLAVNLNEMLDSVQVLMESLRQVSSDIAHDLRTPLSRLRQRLESISMHARSVEDYKDEVEKAIVDTDSILSTFAALLRIAQLEGGMGRSAFATVDLSALFRSLGEAYDPVADEAGQTLSTLIERGISVQGDRELLTQMLANLIENAIRHAPAGARIDLALRHDAKGPVGIVADNGPGIPPDARDKVFRRFFRLENSRTTAGSGLGLSLVAAVADIHGIRITLSDNDPGLKVTLDFTTDHRVGP